MDQVLQYGGVQVQRVVFLCEIADFATMTVIYGTSVRLLQMRKQPQSSGLTGTVVSQNHHARTLVNSQVHAGEHNVRTVGFRNILCHDWRTTARSWFRETNIRHFLLLLRLGRVLEEFLRAAHHVLCGHGLGGLRVQANTLLHEAFRLLFGDLAFAAATFLVNHALVQVGLPAEGIHVNLAKLRIQMPHLVHHFVQQFGGVGDDQESTLVFLQVSAQPFDGVGVQMVGRFVEDQCVRIGEQDAGQFDTTTLAAGKRAQLLAHDLLRQTETCRHGGRFGLCGIAAGLFEILHGLVVAVHRLGHDIRIRIGHVLFGLAYAFDDAGDVSRAHHAVQCGLLRVGGMRVLWQIAEFAGDTYLAGGRQHIAGDHTGQRGLACSIASDQTDLVPLGNVEVGGMQQRARTDLNLKSLRLNRHAVIPLVFRVPSNANRTS